jgi:hypothetical protein
MQQLQASIPPELWQALRDERLVEPDAPTPKSR